MSYKHYSIKERKIIEKYRKKGYSYREIGNKLGRSHSSILREIKRNSLKDGSYDSDYADIKYVERRERSRIKDKKLENLQEYIKEKIILTWSPEQISNKLKKDNAKDKLKQVSTKQIYKWIYSKKIEGISKKYLRKKGKKYIHTKMSEEKINISKRPVKAEKRIEIGHWEIDTVKGNRESVKCVATYADRKTRYYIGIIMKDSTAEEFNKVTIEEFKARVGEKVRTFTADNGKEFSNYKELKEKINIQTYFTNKSSPWQRGTNENFNGQLREFFPKGTNFAKVKQEELDKAIELINNRPRKCLNWKSPKEVFEKYRMIYNRKNKKVLQKDN